MGNPVKLRTLNHDRGDLGAEASEEDMPTVGGYSTKAKSATKNSATKDPKKGKNLVTKHAVKMLAFPSAVEKDGQGHYIHFKIHAHEAGKVHSSKKPGTNKRLGALGTTVAGSENNQKLMESRSDTQAGQRSYYASMAPPRRELATSIALYMPASVTVNYSAGYSDTDIGIVTEGAVAAVQEYTGTQGNMMKKGTAAFKSAVGTASGQSAKWLASLGEKMGMTGQVTDLDKLAADTQNSGVEKIIISATDVPGNPVGNKKVADAILDLLGIKQIAFTC